MTRSAHNELAARLYLEAVLPVLADLGTVSEKARQVIQGWKCEIELAIAGQGGTSLVFNENKVAVVNGRNSNTPLSLFFFSSAQLVKQFGGTGFSLPLPRRGVWRLGSWLRFMRLGKILESELEQHPQLLLGVALGSLEPLTAGDVRAQVIMRDCPSGIAEFSVARSDLAAWVEWRAGKIKWGRGCPLQPADVRIQFRDEPTALKLLRGELDELAAIGLGDLKVHGLVPLAEALGAVMELAEDYLERK